MNKSENKATHVLPALLVLSIIFLCYVASAKLTARSSTIMSSYTIDDVPRTDAKKVVNETQSDGIRTQKQVAVLDGTTVDCGNFESWYANGELRSVGQNDHGKRHGKWKYWDEQGYLICEQSFVDGQLHGPYQVHYTNGQPAIVGEIDHGKRHGEWTFFDEAGHPMVRGSFESGLPLGDWVELDCLGNVVKSVAYRELAFE